MATKSTATVEVRVGWEEYYPVITLERDLRKGDETTQVDRKLFNRFKRNMEEFDAIQQELHKVVGY